MANIRRQAIASSILTYLGFFVGAINIYLYTKNGSFTAEEYGLTRLFFDFAQNFYAWGSLGVISVLYKFYPYYNDNLPDRQNDLLTWVLCAATLGFTIVCVFGYVFEPLVIKKFIKGSPLFLEYYFWVFPFAMGMLFYSVLEGYMWALHKTVLSNFLKETALRLITTVFILLRLFNFISFPTFIKLFALLYLLILVALIIHLISIHKFHITFTISRVTKKFWKKMVFMQSLIFGGTVIRTLGQTIDGILIASLINLPTAGIFTLAQYMASLVQVPQRSLESISVGVLSRAWKDKNYAEINRVYSRTCINLLIMALFIYGNLALNMEQAIAVFGVKEVYREGIQVMLIMGIARLIDAGTGVNNIIIGTSTYWRFDFLSGVVLLFCIIPTNYVLIKAYGINGAAYAQVISFFIYNVIRFEFLRRKFNMQPFNKKTLYSLLTGIAGFALCYYFFGHLGGWTGLFVRSLVFSGVLVAGVFAFELTPDAMQLYHNFVERRKRK